jgi:hypothetical protein
MTPRKTPKNFLKDDLPSYPMNKPPSKRRESGTVAKLAKALGYTPRHTGTLLKAGMPDSITGAREWLAERENSDTAAELRRCRIALLREQERLARIKADEADGLLMPRAEVERQHVAIASAMKAFLRRYEREIPQVCLGLTLPQSMPLVKAKTRELQNLLADIESEFWIQQPNHKP